MGSGPEGESGAWAKIEIEFPAFNQCGERTPIRGFFVTMDQHFAIESDNSEMNAWPTYITKNVAKYPYETINGVTKIKSDDQAMLDMFEQGITLQEGNKGTIWLKDARNLADGDVVGFRVHAVNLDGTFTDPDGRAFYVQVGNKSNHHALSFHITSTDYENGDSAVQDKVGGKNPVAQFNKEMAANKKGLHFFERPAYGPSYENQDDFRVVYTWREDNPAIRAEQENSTMAYWPVAGTGLNADNDYNSGIYSGYALVQDRWGDIPYSIKTMDYSVEKFFSFKFSNDNIADNANIDKGTWYAYNELDPDGNYGANVKTNSVLGFINPEVADRLIDGATYKITMTIQQLDQKTTWITKNVIDIDITKVMPTESGLTVKTGQTDVLKNGVWEFYVRPLVEDDLAMLENQAVPTIYNDGETEGEGEAAADPWKITWTNFAPDFETDFNADGEEIENAQHLYRWAADTRPWTLDEMFNGIIENGEVNPDFYFVFEGAGNFLSAHNQIGTVQAKEGWSTEALYDDLYKDDDGTAVYNPNPAPVVSVEGDDTHQVIGYRMPYVHYSHINDGNFNVLAGKVFRRISAELDGEYFKVPLDEKEGNEGFITPILNRDYKIKAAQIKTTDGKDLVAQYKCARGNFMKEPGSEQGKEIECKYNESKAIDIFGTEVKMAKNTKFDKMSPVGNSYVDTQFPAAWSSLPTLADLVSGNYLWIDYASLEVVLPSNAPYILSEWYDYYFAETEDAELEDAIDPSDAENNSKIKYFVVRPNRTGLFPALNKDYSGIKVKFNAYDIWHHGPMTFTIKGIKVLKPENQAARQAR